MAYGAPAGVGPAAGGVRRLPDHALPKAGAKPSRRLARLHRGPGRAPGQAGRDQGQEPGGPGGHRHYLLGHPRPGVPGPRAGTAAGPGPGAQQRPGRGGHQGAPGAPGGWPAGGCPLSHGQRRSLRRLQPRPERGEEQHLPRGQRGRSATRWISGASWPGKGTWPNGRPRPPRRTSGAPPSP